MVMTLNRKLIAVCTLISGVQALCAEEIYQESDGLVVIEMENTKSKLGQWIKIGPGDKNFVKGATGSGHLEFTGNTINGGDPASPLEYKFRVSKGGKYFLNMRGRKRLAGAEWDKCNDCYVKLEGDFKSGNPEYATKVLKTDTKVYLPSPQKDNGAKTWAWAENLDSKAAHHVPAIYTLKAGKTYTFTISGRSIRYNLDRVVFRHQGVPVKKARNPKLAESRTTSE